MLYVRVTRYDGRVRFCRSAPAVAFFFFSLDRSVRGDADVSSFVAFKSNMVRSLNQLSTSFRFCFLPQRALIFL